MTTHTTASREKWLAARLKLLEAEKELTRQSDEVARQRQQLPWVPVNTGMSAFAPDDGSSTRGQRRGSASRSACSTVTASRPAASCARRRRA